MFERNPSFSRAGRSRASAALATAAIEALEGRQLFAVNPNVVDYYVGYTAQALERWNGSEQRVVDEITRAVARANQTFANSKVNVSLRLVGTFKSETPEAGDGSVDVASLKNLTDGKFDDVSSRGVAAGADVISLITKVGTSTTSGTYSTITATFISTGVMSHELGHTFGGDHSLNAGEANTHSPQYATESRLNFNGNSIGLALSGNLNYFSNPNVLFRGVQTGVAGQTDNARVMNDNAVGVAATRAVATPDLAGPIAGLGSVQAINGQNEITFRVRYIDGNGVNADSLGNDDVRVTGPGGLNALATFVSVDDASVNYAYKVATYRIATPGAVGAITDYRFALETNGVSDGLNNFAPAGPVIVGGTPALPDYAGDGEAFASEEGDLTNKTMVVTDEVGPRYGITGYLDFAYYRFNVVQTTTFNVTVNSPTAGLLRMQLFQDKNNNLQFDQGDSIEPTRPGVWENLPAGENYYWMINPWDTGTVLYKQATLTVKGTSTGAPPPPPPAAASVAGSVFTDTNNNGTRDTGEAGIAGVGVQLKGTDDQGKAVVRALTTDNDGNYRFADLRPSAAGGYTLTENQPAATPQGQNRAGTLGGVVAGDTITGINVVAGANGTGYTFGEGPRATTATLSGAVYFDANDDGQRQADEAGIADVQIIMAGTDLAGNNVSLNTKTDANGVWKFDNLGASQPNGYNINEVQPANVLDGKDTVGSLGEALPPQFHVKNGFLGITLNGEPGVNYLFGERSLPTTNPPAPPPTPTPQPVTVPEDNTTAGTILPDQGFEDPGDFGLRRSLVAAQATSPLYAQLVSGPSHAFRFSLARNGDYTYTPSPNYNGPDQFTYQVVDANGRVATATVPVNVTPVDDAPELNDETTTYVTSQLQPIDIDLSVESRDVDSTGLTFALGTVTGGTAQLLNDGCTVRFTPGRYFQGIASIGYTCSDGISTSAMSVEVCVIDSPEAPVSHNDVARTLPSTPVTINVLKNDGDPEGDRLFLASATAPNGTARIDDRGTADPGDDVLVYTPKFGFHGTDTVLYTVTDIFGSPATGEVNVTIKSGVGIGVDPTNPTRTALDVFGSAGNDTVTVANAAGGKVSVKINSGKAELFAPTGIVAVYGDDGNDTISANSLNRRVWLFGENGNDKLTGGAQADLLVGGAGGDSFTGGAGNDAIITGLADYETKGIAPLAALFNGGSPSVLANYVHDDNGAADRASGGAGDDTFWARLGSGKDSLQDRKPSEQVLALT